LLIPDYEYKTDQHSKAKKQYGGTDRDRLRRFYQDHSREFQQAKLEGGGFCSYGRRMKLREMT
jgi:hypothetical protein